MGTGLSFAVIGDPVDHSRSPRIHTAALASAGLNGTYSTRRAREADLPAILAELREGILDGVNVTMPLKSAAWAATELPTGEATRSMSVNTLRCREARIEGHSTDAVAFSESFGLDGLRTAPILVLGGGGSARAALSVIDEDRTVYLSTRSGATPDAVSSAVTPVRWGAAVAGAVVVNATPLGMAGEDLPAGIVEAAAGLIDLPYGDAPTKAVSKAIFAGIPTVDGLEFLARQARASFTWWTGSAVELEVLERAARNI